MIKNPVLRRRLSVGLLVSGGILLALAPENAWMGLALLIFAGVLEAIGVWIGHADTR